LKQIVENEGIHADVSADGQQIRLVIAPVVDGWLGAVVYPATRESISLFELSSIEDAKAKAEEWVRIVYSVTGALEWIPGTQR
jgi:hypothetical protein